MRHVAKAVAVAITLLAAVVIPTAQADPLAKPRHPEARKKLDEGNRYYELKDYERAIETYKAGYVLSPDTVFLYNLGQANRFLKRYDEAIGYYQDFLARGRPTGDLRVYVENFINVMRDAKEKELAARNQPPVEPEPVGEAPSQMRARDHRLRVDSSPRSPDPWYADRVGWLITGAGALTIGVGSGFLFSAAGLSNDAESEPDQSERERLRDLADSRRVIGIGVAVAGGAILVAGVIKLAVSPGKSLSREPRSALAFYPGGVAIRGTF